MSGPGRTSLMPLAALTGAAVVAAYLASPSRKSSPSSRRREALIAYLRDHLSGSDIATRVVHRLSSIHQESEDGRLFHRLAVEFEAERSVVRTLLSQLGASARSVKRAAGFASGVVASATAGGEPGDLALFRTLEALSVGVQGKRCLWRALQDLPRLSAGMDFVELEAMAVRQWEAIDERRRALVEQTFGSIETRAER